MTLETLDFQHSLSQLIETKSALKEYRQKAWKRLEKVGLPTPKTEAYRYLKLQGLLKTPYESASLKDPNQKLIEEAVAPFKDAPYLVVYNGHFLPRFSSFDNLDPRVIVKPISDALYSYSVFFKNMFEKWIDQEKDPFSLMSLALHKEGIFIYVPANLEQKEPLAIIEINEGKEREVAAPFTVLSIGKNSSFNLATVSKSHVSPKFLSLQTLFVHVEENAKASISHGPEMEGAMRFETLRVWQKKRSHFSFSSAYIETSRARLDCHAKLLGEGCETDIITLSTLKRKNEMHTHILVEHCDEDSYSRQLVKNIYDDESLGSFEGKIYVHKEAQKTNAYQLNQNCLLSDGATTYSKPNLEIFADDVKASHGSTTGQIEKEHLFYLQSRGLSKEEAKKLLLSAFCQEVVDLIPSKAVQKITLDKLNCYFKGT